MIRAVKGTRDLLPPDTSVWNHVERTARDVFRRFRYSEIRTPIFEQTELFARGVGEETDIVTKEMYTWEDRDGASLTLRPENTASVIRAYIEHRLDQRPGLQKLFYMGPMFRRERPQKGRFRQFYQIGAEVIGSESPLVDGEVIEMVVTYLREVGLRDFKLLINSVGDPESRARYVAKLREELQGVKHQLSEDNQRRAETNPLRVLDSKDPQDEPVIAALPSIHEFLNGETKAHFDAVLGYLTAAGIEFEVRPRLVRGLDYYTRTTFEIVHGALGAQNSVLGGGRYDGLAESLGSKLRSPGIGYSIGADRLVMSLQETRAAALPREDVHFALLALGDAAMERNLALARALRRKGATVEVFFEGKLKRAMDLANRLDAERVVILGDDELARGVFVVKDMRTGEQNDLSESAILDLVS
ncbi:MAG: histidine--tRNA ligase [Bryobacterales bacterium]|nr:histidine--tRNA ligase [Bryobacterales bacterium]